MTTIKLHNSKNRQKQVFTPIDAQNVRMYVCGPTVYDRAHLGNARPVVVFDILNRLLRHVYGDTHVTYARNFTDVDDKINARAAESGREIAEITAETTAWFLDDMAELGAMEPDHMPRATQYIPQMIDMIEGLIAKGHAYSAEGHVLFSVESYKEYGALSGRSVDDMIAGARVEVAPYKRNPMDFVLWKPSTDDQPGWESPWSHGRPGWHIECSAMAYDLLGESFDIHGGGNDLMFPHHENEIAQSCCAHPEGQFASLWIHNEMLQVEGKKMSKSLGNTILPEKIIKQSGADILRLWVVNSDYTEDMRIGNEILQGQMDNYRRLRNTLRFILGNLSDWEDSERVDVDQMPELEQWVLHRLSVMDEQVRKNSKGYEFSRMFAAVQNFCTLELSAFYFDVRKDVLYCDGVDDIRRRSARTVLDQLFHCLTSWLAPVLVFTAEETWLSRFPEDEGSVHMNQFPDVPDSWRNEALDARWSKVRAFRRVVTGALEIERREKRIGSSLQAAPTVHVDADFKSLLETLPLDDICITSGLTLTVEAAPADAFTLEDVAGVAVVPGLAEGEKCQRCWKVLDEVGKLESHDDLCGRCADVVSGLEA